MSRHVVSFDFAFDLTAVDHPAARMTWLAGVAFQIPNVVDIRYVDRGPGGGNPAVSITVESERQPERIEVLDELGLRYCVSYEDGTNEIRVEN